MTKEAPSSDVNPKEEGTATDPAGLKQVSPHARELFRAAIMYSLDSSRPGFITEDDVQSLDHDSGLAIIELLATGAWDRQNDGYRVISPRAAAELRKQVLEMERRAKECETRGRHFYDGQPGQPVCDHCGAPLIAPENSGTNSQSSFDTVVSEGPS